MPNGSHERPSPHRPPSTWTSSPSAVVGLQPGSPRGLIGRSPSLRFQDGSLYGSAPFPNLRRTGWTSTARRTRLLNGTARGCERALNLEDAHVFYCGRGLRPARPPFRRRFLSVAPGLRFRERLVPVGHSARAPRPRDENACIIQAWTRADSDSLSRSRRALGATSSR
jgi:hypothetical protein